LLTRLRSSSGGAFRFVTRLFLDSPCGGAVSLADDTASNSFSAMTANRSLPSSDPPSPCIGVCVINPQTQLCEGCSRTLDEIAAWWDYTPNQKHRVIEQLEERLARIMDSTFFD
jgi:predicted Fe-S protein YdhL (DUF1289 family)